MGLATSCTWQPKSPVSTLLRLFLKALRPFTIAVLNDDGQIVLRVTRPFRFYFHRAEIVDRQGRSLGVIERRFSIARRIYAVSDTSGHEIFQLFGPILHPWTFEIRNAGVEYGTDHQEMERPAQGRVHGRG